MIGALLCLVLQCPPASPPVDLSALDHDEELSESLAAAMIEFADAVRRRDVDRLGGFFSAALEDGAFPSRPGPETVDLKWLRRHAWESDPLVPAQGRAGLAARLAAFLTHFEEIDDAGCDVETASFHGRDGVVNGEARIGFRLVGSDPARHREWVRGRFRIDVHRAADGSWQIAGWTTEALESETTVRRLFSEVSSPAGISSAIPFFDGRDQDGFLSHGGAAADLDLDGLIDLAVTERDGVRLFLNDGKGGFRDASDETLLSLAPRATSVLPLDFDNDGDADLFLSVAGRQVLLENRVRPTGRLVFDDISEEAGVALSAIGFSAAAADINADGRPDIYVTSYNRYGLVMPDGWGDAGNGTPNLLFASRPGGRFREEAHRLGVDDGRWSLAAAFADLDGDGAQDLYVANDFGVDALLMRRGDRFVDEGEERGARDPGNGMGVSLGDPDNDGDLDLHVTDMSSIAASRILARVPQDRLPAFDRIARLASGNTLYVNEGGGRFRDVSSQAGGFPAGWAWGGGFVDFDNDGWEDLYTANGFITGRSPGDTSSLFWRHVVACAAGAEEPGGAGYRRRHMGKILREGMSFSGGERDRLYLGLGGGLFRDISGLSSADSITDGRATIFADFDNDGDLDIVVTTFQNTARLLYRNDVGQDNPFLRVTLEGTASGRDAFGAVVRIRTPLGIQTKIKSGGSGFLSSHDPRLLFGLGGGPIEWLEVTWPSGLKSRFTGVRSGESLRIREGAESPERIQERRFRLAGD